MNYKDMELCKICLSYDGNNLLDPSDHGWNICRSRRAEIWDHIPFAYLEQRMVRANQTWFRA